jgi:hypothetical protein
LNARRFLASTDAELVATLDAGWVRRTFVPLFWLGLAFVGTGFAHGAGATGLERWTVGIPVVLGAWSTADVWWRRAIVTRDAAWVRGLLGARVVAFEELVSFTYDARVWRLYLFIPFGSYAWLRLSGRRGTATLHSGFARFKGTLPYVVKRVMAATLERMRRSLDAGEPVRFGRRLTVDRDALTWHRRLRRDVRIPLATLVVRVEDGLFHLSDGDRDVTSIPVRSTPDLLALPQLLAELEGIAGRPRSSSLAEALKVRR